MDGDTIELFKREEIPAYKSLNRPSRRSWFLTWLKICLTIFIFILGFSFIYKVIRNSDRKILVAFVNPKGSGQSTNKGSKFVFKQNTEIKKEEVDRIKHLFSEINKRKNVIDSPNDTISKNTQCDLVKEESRFDCLPTNPIQKDICESRGCCWNSGFSRHPPLDVPYCYYPSNFVGYQIVNIVEEKYKTIIEVHRSAPSGYPLDSQTVKIEVIFINENTLRIRFYDPNTRRYEVPLPKLNMPLEPFEKGLYDISCSKDGELMVVRPKTGTIVFKTDLNRLIFSNQYLEISSRLPTKHIYGLGEHKDTFRKDVTWKRYTMFNRDQAPVENTNLYGSQPFYMAVEDDEGNSHGVLLFNSNAMDILTQPTPAITWRTIGGILDFYIFMGPSPSDVVRQYITLVGKPELPPFWGLGFQLCRFGYGSLNKTIETWNRTRQAGIPFDVQWNDIDYMEDNKDFTFAKDRFAGLPSFVDKIHEVNMHYVMMFDPGVSASEKTGTYPPFDDGQKMNIFIKNSSGQNFIGKVWNTKSTVWPDFTNPAAVTYWMNQFKRFNSQVKYDGSWIDMNEPSNFLNGGVHGCPNNSIENPMYTPGDVPLRTRTICMSAVQHAGLHYNLHNLFGLYEAKATNIALKTVLNKRPFIISRASATGLGNFGGHWSGDLFSTFDHMKWSIASILNFNMFGVPLVGADICGFNGNTTVELCARWSALGAFYPFSRNHNSDDCIEQDPVAMGAEVISAAKNALNIRYSLLPYFYTQFYRAHLYGDTVVRPLFFEFPKDKVARSIETQFMWGAGLMIVPILEESAVTVDAYFPASRWFDFVSQKLLIDSDGEYKRMRIPIDEIVVALRGGNIIANQHPMPTTTETRGGNFSLLVALDGEGKSCGELFWDDGDSLNTHLEGRYNHIQYSVEKNILTSKATHGQYVSMTLADIVILGVDNEPTTVVINDKKRTFTYDTTIKRLKVTDIGIDLLNIIQMTWN